MRYRGPETTPLAGPNSSLCCRRKARAKHVQPPPGTGRVDERRKILVVDDEPNPDIVSGIPGRDGFRSRHGQIQQAAWEALKSSRLLFRSGSPRSHDARHGRDHAAAKIKADERLHSIPVIMADGSPLPRAGSRRAGGGAFYYLTKPFEGEALQTIIRSALDDMRTRRELNANLADNAIALSCINDAFCSWFAHRWRSRAGWRL